MNALWRSSIEGGLQALHFADKNAVNWLGSRQSAHSAYDDDDDPLVDKKNCHIII